jgi:hypothetical protein
MDELEFRDLLRMAREALFPDGPVPENTMDRRAMIPFSLESPGSTWPKKAHEQGKRLSKCSEDLEARLKQFARDKSLVALDAQSNGNH